MAGSGWTRTNSGALDHVADGESLDRLVLWGASGAVGATDGLDMAAAFLVASAGKVCQYVVTLESQSVSL